jgi:hypothetical protein
VIERVMVGEGQVDIHFVIAVPDPPTSFRAEHTKKQLAARRNRSGG